MLSVNIGAEVASTVIFLLLLILVVLVYIAYLINNFNGKISSSEKVIEKHIYRSGFEGKNTKFTEKPETDSERREKIQRDIDLEDKWNKNRDLESKINGIGSENIVDGKSSLDAVNALRKLNEGNKNKS